MSETEAKQRNKADRLRLDIISEFERLQSYVQKPVKIRVERNDDIEAWGAYVHPTLTRDGEALVLLNIESCAITALTEDDVTFKEMLIHTLVHEFAHVLEEWYGLEFSEERVDQIVGSYFHAFSEQDPDDIDDDLSVAAAAHADSKVAEVNRMLDGMHNKDILNRKFLSALIADLCEESFKQGYKF